MAASYGCKSNSTTLSIQDNAKNLHETHLRVNKMKALEQGYVRWPKKILKM